MKTEKNILFAFILNFSFSVFEFFGGLFTNSVAILSDSIHDMGDALSIGISFFLEKKSKKSQIKNILIHVWSIDGFNNYATMHIVT